MDRRELLALGVAAGSAAAVSVLSSTTPAFGAVSADRLLETSTKCVAAGLRCVSHCQGELAKGNKDMAACMGAVTEMLAACEGLQKLAAMNSKHLAAYAKTCAAICGDCAKACEKHAQHMEVCKACMNACKECEKACLA